MAWLPDRAELAAIWRVLGDLVQRVRALEERLRDDDDPPST